MTTCLDCGAWVCVHVSRHADPRTVPVHTPHGPVWLRCDTTHTTNPPTIKETP